LTRGGPTAVASPRSSLFGSNRPGRQNLLGSRHLGLAKTVLDTARAQTEAQEDKTRHTLPDTDPLHTYSCEGSDEYIVPDPAHCDRYLSCPNEKVELCQSGMLLDLNTGYCTEGDVDCRGREMLYRSVEKMVEDKLEDTVKKIEKETADRMALMKKTSFDKIPITKGGSSDANNPSRPLVLQKQGATSSLEDLTCSQSEEGYIVPDPGQCDRYAECSPHGEKTFKLCPDGLALSLQKGLCDYPVKVDCTDRPLLQSPSGEGHCIRKNGNFPLPAEVSCSKYVDCREGEGYVQSCGAGAVFDEVLGCVHPDETNRRGCSAKDKYDFQCPRIGLNQKFGDHDRLPHPTDCNLFYACLARNGQPRLLSCTETTVFNPESGFCDDQENVPGCEGYYVKEEVDLTERDKIAQEIREELIKQFGRDRLGLN